MMKIKEYIPAPIMKIRRDFIAQIKIYRILIKHKFKKLSRFVKNDQLNSNVFFILCIKKIIYADMVIENINSLHYLNSNHKISIYCDTLCYEYLKSKRNKFDYLSNVEIINSYQIADRPWQFYKIETLIIASKQGAVLTDADGIWHDDPIFDKDKITLLVVANKIKENDKEKLLVENIFLKTEWVEFNHYVTGFIYIPSNYMTDKLVEDLRKNNELIYSYSLNFIIDASSRDGLRRLSEELSINLSLQSHYPAKVFSTLKSDDGPGSQISLQSLYYGCLNNVNE